MLMGLRVLGIVGLGLRRYWDDVGEMSSAHWRKICHA